MKRGAISSIFLFLFLFVLIVHGAGAVDVQMNGNVGVSGSVTATSLSGSGAGLTNLDPTKISSGTANINISGNAGNVAGIVGIANGGTGATTPSGARTNLGAGTVMSVGTGAGLTGGPITGSGTISVASGGITQSMLSAGAVSADKVAFYGKIAIVATSGGGYNNPATAMSDYLSWCGTPSAANPCLLKIMPGIYTVTAPVVMQPYIDIEGSGETTTKITGAIGSTSSFPPPGIVQVPGGAPGQVTVAEIRFLTVENKAPGNYNAAILTNPYTGISILHVTAICSGANAYNYGILNYGFACYTMMTNVKVSAQGATLNYGVYNDSSDPTMTNVSASAAGGYSSVGVYNVNSSLRMTNVTATALNATNNYGVYNSSSNPTMRDVFISAHGEGSSVYAVGVWNESGSQPILVNVTADASGPGTYVFGLYNINTAGPAQLDRSTFSALGGSGDTRGIRNDTASDINVGSSKIDGTAVGNLLCIYCYNGNYAALNSSCQ